MTSYCALYLKEKCECHPLVIFDVFYDAGMIASGVMLSRRPHTGVGHVDSTQAKHGARYEICGVHPTEGVKHVHRNFSGPLRSR